MVGKLFLKLILALLFAILPELLDIDLCASISGQEGHCHGKANDPDVYLFSYTVFFYLVFTLLQLIRWNTKSQKRKKFIKIEIIVASCILFGVHLLTVTLQSSYALPIVELVKYYKEGFISIRDILGLTPEPPPLGGSGNSFK